MSTVEVREAASGREREVFVRLPWRLYRGDRNWVPPLLSSARRLLDPSRNPFFEHGRMRLFLAWRGKRPVGRIAAIINDLHNTYHDERTGFWGFFETEPDQAVASALLERVAEELCDSGMARTLGPFNPSVNSECGLLVEGFERPPSLMMPYNPPSYPQLVEAAGHRPHKDLLAYYLDCQMLTENPEKMARMERIERMVLRRHPELTIRTLEMERYEDEVLALAELFNEARRENWGFVPVTRAEALAMAREMKAIVEPTCAIFAEVEGRLVGCVMGLPDIGPLLRKANGRLFPFGWVHLVGWRRRIHEMRIFGAGVLPQYRHLGIIPILFLNYVRNATSIGYDTGELSWVAEDNLRSVRTLEAAFGPRLYKRYRIYERGL